MRQQNGGSAHIQCQFLQELHSQSLLSEFGKDCRHALQKILALIAGASTSWHCRDVHRAREEPHVNQLHFEGGQSLVQRRDNRRIKVQFQHKF